MQDNPFAEKLYTFLVNTPDWVDAGNTEYLGLGTYTISFDIDINNMNNGVKMCEKKYEYLLADLFDKEFNKRRSSEESQ